MTAIAGLRQMISNLDKENRMLRNQIAAAREERGMTNQDRAMEIAEKDQETAHYCLAPTNGVGFDKFHEGVDRVIAALTAAREEGRREGMEEAAIYLQDDQGRKGLAAGVRALAAKEKTTRWQDGDADELDRHTLT